MAARRVVWPRVCGAACRDRVCVQLQQALAAAQPLGGDVGVQLLAVHGGAPRDLQPARFQVSPRPVPTRPSRQGRDYKYTTLRKLRLTGSREFFDSRYDAIVLH